MAKILVGVMAGIVVTLFVFMLTRLSTDALGMAVGVVFGMLAAVPSVLLVLASSRKQADDEEEEEDLLTRWRRERYGERDLPPFPYQPPVIVLAAPRVQGPQVVQPGTAVTRY